jgi:hypothetical protein
MTRLPLFLCVGLMGCMLTTERATYPDQLAEAQCSFDEQCREVDFYHQFLDHEACVTSRVREWDEVKSEYEECGFLEERALECLEWLSRPCKSTGREYDQLEYDCGSVWNCPT